MRGDTMTSEKALQDAIDRIESQLTEELSVKELADGIGYSPWHFARLFAQHIGMGPGRYVRRRRLSEAALMYYSGNTLYDAAAATGFSSVSVLIRAFKEAFGCTPGQFKRGEVNIELQQRAQLVRINLDWRQLSMKNVKWIDKLNTNDPVAHSYPSALYSALVAQGEDVQFSDVMGYSGFAFRLDMHEAMCLSASSVFDWNTTFNFALENMGYEAKRITRLWHQMDERDELREKAITAIKQAMDRGKIPVVWDTLLPEWGLVIGYDEKEDAFACLGPQDMKGALRANQLGQRQIEIMDVTIVEGRKKNKSDEERLRAAVTWAVDHGRGRHWCDTPTYAQGVAAWAMWQKAMVRNAKGEVEANAGAESYFIQMTCAARLNAVRFLREHGGRHGELIEAVKAYETVVETLSPMVSAYDGEVTNEDRLRFTEAIGQAGDYDQQAIEHLEAFLGKK